MRTTGAALVALLVLAGCGSDEVEHASPTTSTTVDAAAPWSRPCHETKDGPNGSAHGSATFGPLGPAPSVVVHLPLAHQSAAQQRRYGEDRYPDVSWARLRGATVIAAAPPFTSDSDTTMVTAVNDDGSVRWTRCLDGVVDDIGAGDDGDLVAVTVRPGPGELVQSHPSVGAALLLDADDGRERGRFDDVDAVFATSGHAVLLGHQTGTTAGITPIALVDLTTGRRTELATPPRRNKPPTFALAEDGKLTSDGLAWQDGAWVPDPDPPTRVTFNYGEPVRLEISTGHWSLPLHAADYKGRNLTQDDRTAVAWTCGEQDAEGHCPVSVVGVDIATGTVLWTRPGEQLLGEGDDGYVLLQHGFGTGEWALHDMRTGDEVEGQRWSDPQAFQDGCCDDGRYRNVGRVGGMVVVVHDTEVRIWFPRVLSHPTVDVQP